MVSKYIDVTNNESLALSCCASCAREHRLIELTDAPLEELPNRELLKPATPHPAHILTNELLLYQDTLDASKEFGSFCASCLRSLKANKQPKFSLANDMWIGDIPNELANLTLPEKILIAKYYSAAQIIKLYPKQKNSDSWDKAGMHNALKGNVSTYHLDSKQVVSMVEGRKYPPNPKILSATIGVTFVGPKGVPEKVMPYMFRVRRRRVREALVWLKANNPLYANIQICEENLASLPEDGVPEEIMMVVKCSTDIYALEKEHSGYVPVDAADEGAFSMHKTE